MTRARILADYVSGGTTAAEFDYMDGVTSNVQTQMDLKAPLASPALVTPNLGTPSAGVMTNVTGMPLAGLSATGTASSTTYLRGDNSWQTAGSTSASDLDSGTLGTARMPTGSVLQCLHVQTTTGNSSSTTTTYANFTNLTLTINPIATSSKVFGLINAHIYPDSHTADSWHTANFAVHHSIVGGASGVMYLSAGAVSQYTFGSYTSSDTDRKMGRTGMTFLHSPSTTAATTYQVQYNSGQGGGMTVYENSVSYGRSELVLMEIAG